MSRMTRYVLFRSPAMLLLAIDILQIGVYRIPTITLMAMTSQIAFFMHLPEIIGLVTTPSLSDLCLIPETVILRGGFMNIFISAFFHADDWHLYFNTVAFISKAPAIERHFGTAHFGLILFSLVALTGSIHTVIALVLDIVTDSSAYGSQCSIGFSDNGGVRIQYPYGQSVL